MFSALVAAFDIARYGFGFVNQFADPFILKTPLGKVSLGQNAGLCGGMTFGTLDYYSAGRAAPNALADVGGMFDYLCERQQDSLDLPGGVYRYMSWQTTTDSSVMMFGRRISEGISYSTLVTEWPRVRGLLDAGFLAPLGLIRTDSSNPKDLSENHQVLAYGYELNTGAELLTLRVCDPNFPRDGSVTLRMGTGNPDFFRPILHSHDGKPIRGFFLSNYVNPKPPPG